MVGRGGDGLVGGEVIGICTVWYNRLTVGPDASNRRGVLHCLRELATEWHLLAL
jgi:hypothetical protein